LRLAPAGQSLLGYAERLLALPEEARSSVHDPKPRGLFRLGSMESTAAIKLPKALNEYHRLYPEVTLELRIGNPFTLASAILAGQLDAALVAEPIANEPFDRAFAYEEEPVVVSAAGRPAPGKKGEFPRTMVAFEHGCPYRKRLEDWYAKRGVMPERTVELGSYHAMLGCVAAGMGIALIPKSVLTTFPESKRLGVHHLPPGENRAEIVLIWRKGASSPNIQALRDIVQRPQGQARG